MAKPGSKSKPKKGIDEHKSKQVIEHSYGLEERTVHVRGSREDISRVFYKSNGKVNIELTIAQAILDKRTPEDEYLSLYQSAEELFKVRGERTLFEYYDCFENEDFGNHSGQKYDILSAIWAGNVVEKYGAVSPEAMAAQFLTSSAGILRRCGQSTDLAKQIFALCAAWHGWTSEIDGEHTAAFQNQQNQANLSKAGPARSKIKEKRVKIVREEAESFWREKPNYTTNASGTASTIHEGVNRRLAEELAGTYTLGSLEKAVGSLIRSRGRSNG